MSLVLFSSLSPCVLSPAQDTGEEDPSDDWASPPSLPPEDRQPKRSKLDDLVGAEFALKPLGFAPTRQFNSNSHRAPSLYDLHEQEVLRSQEMHLARLARLERSKADAAAIIAAAAATQKAAEERAIVEAAAAAEEQNKEEERKAERERRRKERKDSEAKRHEHGQGHGREDEREKRLLKLVGAVVVKTMSKYRTRMDVDTFKKHAKEVRALWVSNRCYYAGMLNFCLFFFFLPL